MHVYIVCVCDMCAVPTEAPLELELQIVQKRELTSG